MTLTDKQFLLALGAAVSLSNRRDRSAMSYAAEIAHYAGITVDWRDPTQDPATLRPDSPGEAS